MLECSVMSAVDDKSGEVDWISLLIVVASFLMLVLKEKALYWLYFRL